MVAFLSPDWIDALDEAGRLVAVAPDVRLTVQQVVSDAPAGAGGSGEAATVRYHLVIGDGTIRVRPGQAASPDVTLLQSYDVAVALSRGEVSAQSALAVGRLKVAGALERLVRHGAALAAVEDGFASVRERTSY